jgi:glucosamine-6-phosphate deaminase
MSIERVPVKVYPDDRSASRAVARRVAEWIRLRNAENRPAVLGLATGNTPINVYRELARMRREEGLDFSRVVTFNLDEYWPIDPQAHQSYHRWMDENFFKHVNVPKGNIHIPSGTVAAKDLEKHCRQYEEAIRAAGGIDFQVLGIGRTGHVGFNEPGSPRDSRTRRIRLDMVTRKDAAADFFGEENVPETAITMGVGTILEAREVALLAFGEHKAPILQRAVEGEISPSIAASYLQTHPCRTFYLDQAAAASLTRFATPWLLGACPWDDLLERQAVIWLAQKLEKPILKLTEEDYAENGLADLLAYRKGGSYQCNIHVFRRLMNTITGWPGGKERKHRVLVLSPHPDDDVISMGGTLMRFVEQGHEVHTAYMASGYLSVFDHDVQRHADFVHEFNTIFALRPEDSARIERHIDKFLLQKKPGDMDTDEVRQIKALVRRTEALDAARYCGIPEDRTHFLDLPFYDTGLVQKLPVGPKDVERVYKLLEKVKPDVVFAAGDLSDPHGTHRMCLEAARAALDQYAARHAAPVVWLYRGAWQEWTPELIDMAVPLAPDELKRKRFAIFRHQSQKDRAMFPGPYDSREFWQRAEERNMGTASLYDKLGLPEYHAIEAFARWPLGRSAHAAAQLEKE